MPNKNLMRTRMLDAPTLFGSRHSDLQPGDFVIVECASCGHDGLIHPAALPSPVPMCFEQLASPRSVPDAEYLTCEPMREAEANIRGIHAIPSKGSS